MASGSRRGWTRGLVFIASAVGALARIGVEGWVRVAIEVRFRVRIVVGVEVRVGVGLELRSDLGIGLSVNVSVSVSVWGTAISGHGKSRGVKVSNATTMDVQLVRTYVHAVRILVVRYIYLRR